MKMIYRVASYFFIFLLISCSEHRIYINVPVKPSLLGGISGGSGILVHEEKIYIVGDDMPYLFTLDSSFNLVQKHKICETPTDSNFRIVKSDKPDFEAIEKISDSLWVVLGSGSKSPQRDTMVLLYIGDTLLVKKHALTKFYQFLQSKMVMNEGELNIEGLAHNDGRIYLLNRHPNIVFDMDFDTFMLFVEHGKAISDFHMSKYKLPHIKGVEAGFSGATFDPISNKLLFTASVENTNNAYDDGEILGSFVGLIPIENNRLSMNIHCVEIPFIDKILKIESLSIIKKTNDKKTEVIFISDEDDGTSTLMKGVLNY